MSSETQSNLRSLHPRVNSIRVNNFSLQSSLESGQFFRYRKVDSTYYLAAQEKIVAVRQHGNRLWYEGASEKWIREFFNLDADLESVYSDLQADPILSEAIDKFRGLRILRQDPWECLISFICSTARSIPIITENLDRLCRHYGEEKRLDDIVMWTFPPMGSLDSDRVLRNCKSGFRAKYLVRANEQVTRDVIDEIRSADYTEAKGILMTVPGVGEKVADCVLLFGFGFMEAFPVDTWVQQAVSNLYFSGKRRTPRQIREWAADRFGPNAGYAQQYLYHSYRAAARALQL